MTIAPQVPINLNVGGNCNGGNPTDVYKYAINKGLPQEGCQAFVAKNPTHFNSSDIHICQNCNKTDCWAQRKYIVWKATQHGLVEGAERIKA